MRRCTLPSAKLLEILRAHKFDSQYLTRFLAEPFLDSWLEDDRTRALLAMRSRVKEISEAYAVLERVRSVVAAHATRLPKERQASTADGAGLVILDVCSGKGLGATLLSFALPEARIVMVDANGSMELAHVGARPNLFFRHVDIFASSSVSAHVEVWR